MADTADSKSAGSDPVRVQVPSSAPVSADHLLDLRFFDFCENANRYGRREQMYTYTDLRKSPGLKEAAAAWFGDKWGNPGYIYLRCMEDYINGATEYGWYLCLDGERIVGGLGVVENDFHDRNDLFPNVCAVYTEEQYRGRGIAGRLLGTVVEDMRRKGIAPLYLVTDHTGFYERYGWEFLCMVQGDGEPYMSRMYIHR